MAAGGVPAAGDASRAAASGGVAAGGVPAPTDASADDDAISAQRRLRFPRDHGAHPGALIEWWYATGWLDRGGGELVGFQLTFFRSRTGLAAQLAGRLAPRQMLFGHAAISQIAPEAGSAWRSGRGSGGHRHAQRSARWSGNDAASGPVAASHDTLLRLAAWRLERRDQGVGSAYHARLAAPEAGFTLELQLVPTQPLLLQGDAGYSRKGPAPPPGGQTAAPGGQTAFASHYYSQPQLEAHATLTIDRRQQALRGRAWLDHEWSDSLMPPGAVGWDWIGINLSDGGALTAFVMRAADGKALWAGGSHRSGSAGAIASGAAARQGSSGNAVRAFEPTEVAFTPLRHWRSPATGASYPVRWAIATPAGRFEIEALLDAQELDSRASTGAVYWEGLAELRDGAGQRLGLGYLEMTGRAAPLRLVG